MPKLRKTTENYFMPQFWQCTENETWKLSDITFLWSRYHWKKFGDWTRFFLEMLKVRKIAKTRVWFHISRTWAVKASKICAIIRIDLKNSFPKFGILNSFHSEMLKVRKSTKNDFNWKVNISRSKKLIFHEVQQLRHPSSKW